MCVCSRFCEGQCPTCGLLFSRSHFGFQFSSTEQGSVDMITEVFLADVFDKASLFHGVHGLFVDVGEDDLHAMTFASLYHAHKCFHTGRINGRHVTHTNAENVNVL